jgi:hypothetical protein
MHGERLAGDLKAEAVLQGAKIEFVLLITRDLFVPATNRFQR